MAFGDHLVWSTNLMEVDGKVRVGGAVFGADGVGQFGHVGCPVSCTAAGRQRGLGFPRDGVAETAAVEGRQLDVVFPCAHFLQHPDEQLVGVGQSLVDVHPGMSSAASFDFHHDAMVFRSGHRSIRAAEGEVHSAGTTDADFAVVLRVEVEQDVATEPVLLELEGAGHACLFIDGEQKLQRRVWNVVRLHHGKHGGHPQSIVGSEGGAFGLDPVVVHGHPDAFGVEIERRVVVFLVDHVHMALEDDRLAVLHAGCGWLANEHIADGVGFDLEAGLFGQAGDPLTNSLFLPGCTGNGVEVCKTSPEGAGFQLAYGFGHGPKFGQNHAASMIKVCKRCRSQPEGSAGPHS